jgi:hypothetical protein
MNKRIALTSFLLVAFWIAQAHGEIRGGTVNLNNCSFDFSAQSCAATINDVDVLVTMDTGCWFIAGCLSTPPSLVTIIIGKTLGEVCGPPADAMWSCGTSDICLQGDEVFVIHTGDGYWAKYALVNMNRTWDEMWEIIYFVQTDGTSNLCPVPVETTTWGKIKTLYE